MLLTAISGALFVIVLGFVKYYARAYGGADGKDDQDHLAWYVFIGSYLVPFILLFLLFRRVSRKTTDAEALSRWEATIYWVMAATRCWRAQVALWMTHQPAQNPVCT